ncbi:MAG: hypothetical protein H6525_07210 [Actinobacteria bacterium]|nr:hypothetical protein [Actinomycetota bacterium]
MIEIIGFVAAACILAASIPQIVELVSHGAHGVSLGSWGLLLATSLVWTAVGFRIESASVIVGNVAGVVAFSIVVVLLVHNLTGRWVATAAVAPVGLVVFGLAMALPLSVTSVIAVLLGLALALPQVRQSYGTLRRGGTSEVARGAWLLLLTGQLLWLGYGLLAAEWSIVIVNVGAASASATVLVLEGKIHASTSRVAHPAEPS